VAVRARNANLWSVQAHLPAQSHTHDNRGPARENGGVNYSTAVRHLGEMAEVASESLGFRDTTFGWPLEELWIGGQLLEFPRELERGSVVLRFNLPENELPWLADQQDANWAAERLRLGKRPYRWAYRPMAWPAWNCRDRRVARFWSARKGVHEEVIDALRRRDAEAVSVVEPSDQELAEQLRSELAVSWRRLRYVLDHYDDHPRRDRNRIYSTDEPLWRAAQGVREVEDALTELTGTLRR
jgi:hypothetical protein